MRRDLIQEEKISNIKTTFELELKKKLSLKTVKAPLYVPTN